MHERTQKAIVINLQKWPLEEHFYFSKLCWSYYGDIATKDVCLFIPPDACLVDNFEAIYHKIEKLELIN